MGQSKALKLVVVGNILFTAINLALLGRKQMANSIYVNSYLDSFPTHVLDTVGYYENEPKDSKVAGTAAAESETKQASPLPPPPPLSMNAHRSLSSSSGSNSYNNETGTTTNAGGGARQVTTRYPKMLIGVFSSDTFNDCTHRKRHRELFSIWNDRRTCSLPEYRSGDEDLKEACQVIYTFVVGAGDKATAPTEIVDDSVDLLVDRIENPYREDINDADVTRLNIKENMNDGKSPTFFYFASTVMEELGFDYAMKLDADALLHLHDYLMFAHNHLPPPPYNTNIFGGPLRDKAGWPKESDPDKIPRKEGFFGQEFEGVHLYMAGQMYFMSYDLCKFVAHEAPFSRMRIAPGGYLEGHEDHDVSAMVLHSPTPVHMITIGKSQRFWEHPVKGEPRWKRVAYREKLRMLGKKFEGRTLRLY